ncbi:MAG: hypothetical protein GPJ54_10365 [Candidatus Heimdallarchaeota archaeon]|nr:hypothetical protein [Candidatus Heimdallarchaeota archaeon]
MGTRSGKDSASRSNQDKRVYTSSNNTSDQINESNPEQKKSQTKYNSPSVPKISIDTPHKNDKSETLREALIRDIGDDLSDFEMDFITNFIAISGTAISYSGSKKEQQVSFNEFIDNMIHKFPNLAMKLSSVQLNNTMSYLKQFSEN